MIEIKRNLNSPDFTFEAKSGDETLAHIHGEITDGVFVIKEYSGERQLFDGVCRAALNGAEHTGAVSAFFDGDEVAGLAACFGYKREIESIYEFFAGKNCK